MMTEVPERIRGAKPVDLRDGEHMLWVVHGDAVQGSRDMLVEVCASVNSEVYGRPLDQSKLNLGREIVDLSLRGRDGLGTEPRNVTVILMVPIYNPNLVVGYLTAREYYVPTNEGLADSLYQTRAILEPFRNKQLGRSAVQQAFVVNNQAVFDIYRTNNPVAVWSTARSEVFGFKEEGGNKIPKMGLPFDMRYSKDIVAQQVMLWSHYEIISRANPHAPFPHYDTGVRIRDLTPGGNPTYNPDEDTRETEAIRNTMEQSLRMILRRGDSVTVVGRVV